MWNSSINVFLIMMQLNSFSFEVCDFIFRYYATACVPFDELLQQFCVQRKL